MSSKKVFFLPPFFEKSHPANMLSAHEMIANVYYPLSIATKLRAIRKRKTLYLDVNILVVGIGLVGEIYIVLIKMVYLSRCIIHAV